MKQKITIHWFRRDLRLDDNTALFHALYHHANVYPLFIFDTEILDGLNNRSDARVTFIYDRLKALNEQLRSMGAHLMVRIGNPMQVWEDIVQQFEVEAVYTNCDYEPYAIRRDTAIDAYLRDAGIPFFSFKDQVVFEKHEVMKEDGTPYTVFTPYSKKWKEKFRQHPIIIHDTEKYFHHFLKINGDDLPSLKSIGFSRSEIQIPPSTFNENLIAQYDQTRDIPSIAGTTRLSVHLRFGTVSIRKLMEKAIALNEKFMNELIWRDFYQMILFHFPHVTQSAFKKEYDRIEWRNNEREFDAWCKGMTGYPMVDAGMRELNATGFMHNRVRMITAGFLCKHLLIDWRWGEAYFAEKLLDFDLASNNGGWQWAAGTGVDAAPYFRIFNPHEQARKFDPELKYVRQWIPEYDELTYPQPIVDHSMARQRCLAVYKQNISGVLQ